MPIIPVRQVGQVGIITDVSPQELPLNAWSDGRNISFLNGKLTRSPALKALGSPWEIPTYPRYAVNVSAERGAGDVLVIGEDASFSQFSLGNIHEDVGPTPAWQPVEMPVTSSTLGQIHFLNNRSDQPIGRLVAAVTEPFERLTNWPSNNRCHALRAYKDFLIALNITKDVSEFPTMVKWSDAMQVGTEPSWDLLALSSLAGENVLNDARGPLVDGLSLGASFYLYTSVDTYRMSYVGTPMVFDFEKVFADLGMINQNCAVEIDGKHYVFSQNDFVIHDGITKQSIADSRIRRRVFQFLDLSRTRDFYVVHDSLRSEVMFCYATKNDSAVFRLEHARLGCNEAAVFNYRDNTWSFVDLPYATAAIEAAIPYNLDDSIMTWENDLNWDSARLNDITWFSSEGASPTMLGFITAGSEEWDFPPTLGFYDNPIGGYLLNPPIEKFLVPAYGETVLRDGDNFQTNLSTTKLLKSIHPQVDTPDPDAWLTITTGASALLSRGTTWGAETRFRPAFDYKCDFRTTGRYLSIRFYIPSNVRADLTGFDLEYEVLAQR